MSLRIRRVSRNYILPPSTTSAWFARTASCLRFPHKGVAKSRLQGHAPPAGNTPTMATLSRPFVKLSGLKAALYAHGVFIKVVFILRDIFCCLFRLIFSTLPLFSLQTTKILLTIFFAFFSVSFSLFCLGKLFTVFLGVAGKRFLGFLTNS